MVAGAGVVSRVLNRRWRRSCIWTRVLGRWSVVLCRRGGILNGLVCVRGELLLSIALDVLLRLENNEDSPTDASPGRAKLLICDRKGSRFAFPVSEVSGVRTYAPNDLKEVPATLSKVVATYTAGVLHIENKIVGFLDDERLFPYLDKNIA